MFRRIDTYKHINMSQIVSIDRQRVARNRYAIVIKMSDGQFIQLSEAEAQLLSESPDVSFDLVMTNFYVHFNLDLLDWVLVRRCKSQKDYIGGTNYQYAFTKLKTEGAEGLANFIRKVLNNS